MLTSKNDERLIFRKDSHIKNLMEDFLYFGLLLKNLKFEKKNIENDKRPLNLDI